VRAQLGGDPLQLNGAQLAGDPLQLDAKARSKNRGVALLPCWSSGASCLAASAGSTAGALVQAARLRLVLHAPKQLHDVVHVDMLRRTNVTALAHVSWIGACDAVYGQLLSY
jgi:hypothetical protein